MTTFANTVKAAFTCDASNTTIVNTMWFRLLAEFGQAEVEDLADALDEWWAGLIVAAMAGNTEYVGTEIYDMRSPDSFKVINDDSNGALGTRMGDAASLASAMTVTFQTNRIGRSYRGRVYLSGFAEPDVSDKSFNSGIITIVDNYFDTLDAALTGLPAWQHVVASRVQNGVVLEEGVTTPVVSYRANARIYKQGERTK